MLRQAASHSQLISSSHEKQPSQSFENYSLQNTPLYIYYMHIRQHARKEYRYESL